MVGRMSQTDSGGCVLAPALFCRAIDWRLDNMTCLKGVAVGNGKFIDLYYADDIVLPANTQADLAPCLTDFSMSARSMGRNVSWTKTKVRISHYIHAQVSAKHSYFN